MTEATVYRQGAWHAPLPSIDISIVIVSWNVREHLKANLARLFSLSDSATREIFVVDNASSDGSVNMLRHDFPQVKLIANDENLGFAKACNQALKLTRGKVIILLNPDMLVEPGALDKVLAKLESDKTIGVLGIKLTDQSGTPLRTVRRFPDVWSQLLIILKLRKFFPGINRAYECLDFDYSRSQDVDQVRGSFFAFRRELLDSVGFLDERFFIWLEEVDYCRRVRQVGLRVHYFAETSAQDIVGASFKQLKRYPAQKMFLTSLVHYFEKWHPGWQAWLIKGARPFGLLATKLADIFHLA
ncbi:MAG: glycosyltransferase family 2 protein [Patescibacteria group bacterium]